MKVNDCLRILVEDIHSVAVATTGDDGHPQTRIIDMMLWDNNGLYFLTAKGKAFYKQLTEQSFIALSAVKGKVSISLRGKIKSIGYEKLEEIFEKNPYMRELYPGDTKKALEVFYLYEAQGEYFDISIPSKVTRDEVIIGNPEKTESGYFVGEGCIGCKLCYSVCPQKCIDISAKPAVINQHRCLRCGRCAQICPKQVIEKRG